MANQNNASAAGAGASGSNASANNTTTYIRASELAANNTRGVIVSGIYLGEEPNPRYGRADYKFRASSGGTVIVNSAASLARAIADAGITAGDMVEVSYGGTETITKGPLKGKNRHLFSVSVKQ